MRVFIAIDIDRKTRAALGSLESDIEGLAKEAGVRKGDVKWVRPEAIHLTLKFLGEVDDKSVAEICNIVKNVACSYKGFEIDIESVGYFGGRSATVLWVGIGMGSNELRRLQKDLDGQLAEAGWPMETREFAGHLTLCRIRNSKAGEKLAKISQQYKDFKLGVISADSITVYQSELKPEGPVYTVLGDYKLG
jgi:2'-5' RNA ligase